MANLLKEMVNKPARKNQKDELIAFYFAAAEIYRKNIDDKLFELVEAGKAASGCLLVYCLSNTYGAQMIQEGLDWATDKKRTNVLLRDAFTVRDLKYYINHILGSYQMGEAFIKEHSN